MGKQFDLTEYVHVDSNFIATLKSNGSKPLRLVELASNNPQHYLELCRKLMRLGVISSQREGNHFVTGKTQPDYEWVPRVDHQPVYFTAASDAQLVANRYRHLQVVTEGTYALPTELAPADLLVIRRKAYLEKLDLLSDLQERGILTQERRGEGFSVKRKEPEDEARRVYLLPGREFNFAQEPYARMFVRGLNEHLRPLAMTRFEITKEE